MVLPCSAYPNKCLNMQTGHCGDQVPMKYITQLVVYEGGWCIFNIGKINERGDYENDPPLCDKMTETVIPQVNQGYVVTIKKTTKLSNGKVE